MKKTHLLLLILTFFIFNVMVESCTREKISPLEGAWKLVHEYEINGENVKTLFPGVSQGSEIKMWTGDRWALVGVFIEDSLITDNFGGGKFTLEGNDYREIVEYHSATEYLGQTVKLWLEIREDTLTQ
ncbi:MAG: hypothetical protein P8100_15750, partial [bacterium]